MAEYRDPFNDGSILALAVHSMARQQGHAPLWQFQDLSQVQIAAMEQRTEEYLQRAILGQVDEKPWGLYFGTPERCLSIILEEFGVACWHPLSAREVPEELLEMHEGRLPGHAEYTPSFCRVCECTLLLKPPIVPRRCRACHGTGEWREAVMPDYSMMPLTTIIDTAVDFLSAPLQTRIVACPFCDGYGRIGEQQEQRQEQERQPL